MSAIGYGKDFTISAAADYHTLVFARMQSQQLRDLQWEGRIKPLQSWSALIARTAAIVILAGSILAFVV